MNSIAKCTMALALSALGMMPVFAQQKRDTPPAEKRESFLVEGQLPDIRKSLPAPPSEGDILFTNDVLRYQWGKTLRPTERGEQAVRDADSSMEYFAKYFSPAFGVEISQEKTPQIYRLLMLASEDAHLAAVGPKNHFDRKRPFVYYGESTPVPGDEPYLRNNGSYPSGHTVRAWEITLVLVELRPDRQDEIMKAGYEYGQSRVIVGFHYQSDVDAARLLSSAVFARQHACETFQEQLSLAKEELYYILNPLQKRPSVTRRRFRDRPRYYN